MDFLLVLPVTIVAALLPTALYVALAWWLDRYEKEPLKLLMITFLWGAIPAIILSLVAEIILSIPIEVFVTGQAGDVISAAVVAPVVEEVFKALIVLVIFLRYRKEFDGLMDGLIYGALVGFGFAMTENIFYFLSGYAEDGWGAWTVLVVLRAYVFGLNHALFTSAFGAGLGLARYASSALVRSVAPLLGLGGAILLHAIHNFFPSIITEETPGLICISFFSDWFGVVVWLVLVYFATRREKQWITQELAEEVANQVIPREHAVAAASYRARLRERWNRSSAGGRSRKVGALHNAAAELAIKKRQLALHGDKHGVGAEIVRLRQQVAQLVAEVR